MKKLLGLFLLAAASAFGLSVNDLKMSQATSASPPAYADRIFTPVANSLVGLDGSIRPVNVTLGANLSLVGNVLSATSSGGSVNWGSIGGVLANQADLVAALAGKQSTLTFSTGLTNTAGTITVNATQVISRLSNLTTNGFVKTSSANGTLTIDTSTYLTTNQTINFTPDPTGDVHGGSSGQTSLAPILVVSGLNDVAFTTMTTGVLKVTNGTGAITTGGTVTSSGLTMATARLLGRTTASSGAVEEISIGSGLSLSGGSLSATGSGGTGTVTTVSVVTANGISGSVATATTTPAITLTLGAITPSTVNALTLAAQTTGFTIAGGTSSKTLTVSGNATVSGTNTGDQTTITGNAGTATALQTARAINGVSFDGTAPITVTADAGTLTGTTLNSTVVTSSLTAVGVIGTGAWQGSVVTGTYGGTGINNSTRTITIAGDLVTVGAFSTTITTTATTTVTLPTSGTLATLGNNETFTGIKTFTPTLRATGSASYLTVNMPADAAITTTVESIGVSFAAGTRTWATGAVALQREHVFGANTVAAAAASTFTTVVNVDIADPIAGTNATITNKYGLRAANALFTTSTTIGAASGSTGTILFKGTTSGTVTLSTADAAGTWTMKLPTSAGSNTNVLTTDGSGNLSWAAAGSSSGANPTASVGLSAVNGSAITFMRSDGAPALAVNIVPTWTGIHTFTPQVVLTGGASFPGGGTITGVSGAVVLTASNSNANIALDPIGTGVTSSSKDVVATDNTSFRGWQGDAARIGFGSYVQRAATKAEFNALAVGTGQDTAFYGQMANGSYGSLTATENARRVTFGIRTYGGTTWLSQAGIIIQTTQTQSETARGCKITLAPIPNTTIVAIAALVADQDGSVKCLYPTGGLGYGTGAGGVVTQGTNRTTGVTLNTVSGAITLVSAAGTTTPATFTVTDSAVAALDTVVVSQTSGTDLYVILVTNVAAGSFKITCYTTGGTTTEQPVFHFNVFKGVSS